MGRMSVLGMRELASEEVALAWHLRSNHFPPIPAYMEPLARRVLRIVRGAIAEHDGEVPRAVWDRRLKLPGNVTHRVTGGYATVWALFEHMHLECFIDTIGDDE